MIKSMLTFLTAWLLAACSASAGPILVGQGTGESEYSLTFARTNLVDLLRTCNGICSLDPRQKAYLNDLIARAATPPAAYFTDLSSVRLFEIQENQRDVAFNQSELWLDDKKTAAFSIPYAVTVWIDVLSQIQPVLVATPQDVEQLKSELLLVLAQRMIRYASAASINEAPFEALIWKGTQSDRLYVRNRAFESYDFTSAITESIKCANGSVSRITINGFRWAGIIALNDGTLSLRIETSQNWSCGNEPHRGGSTLTMKTKAPDAEGIYSIRAQTLVVITQEE